jgi:hypothetical protein
MVQLAHHDQNPRLRLAFTDERFVSRREPTIRVAFADECFASRREATIIAQGGAQRNPGDAA